jgi:hypothetical protein
MAITPQQARDLHLGYYNAEMKAFEEKVDFVLALLEPLYHVFLFPEHFDEAMRLATCYRYREAGWVVQLHPPPWTNFMLMCPPEDGVQRFGDDARNEFMLPAGVRWPDEPEGSILP